MGSAVCAQTDPELFFHGDGSRARRREEKDELARKVCAQCPVMQECRAEFMDEQYGFYGGLSEDERATLRSRKNKYRRTA